MFDKIEELESKIEELEVNYEEISDLVDKLFEQLGSVLIELKSKADSYEDILLMKKICTAEELNKMTLVNKEGIIENIAYSTII